MMKPPDRVNTAALGAMTTGRTFSNSKNLDRQDSAAQAGWLDTPSDRVSDEVAATDSARNVPDASISAGPDAAADEAARARSAAHTAARGKSLVERHLAVHEAVKKAGGRGHDGSTSEAAGGGGDGGGGSSGGPGSGWNRERDLMARSQASEADVRKMIEGAKEIQGRFARPQLSRNFL